MKIIDISQELLTARVYDGDPAPKIESLSNMENGDLYNLSTLSMCLHNGTHIDAPSHFIKGGKTLDKIPLDAFVGKCFVAEYECKISAEDAAKILEKAAANNAAERILLKGNLTVTEEADISGEVTMVIRARTAEDSEQITPEEQLFAIKTNSSAWRGIRVSVILDGREKDVKKLVAKDGKLYSTEEVYIGRF